MKVTEQAVEAAAFQIKCEFGVSITAARLAAQRALCAALPFVGVERADTREGAFREIVEGWMRDHRGIVFTDGSVDDLCDRIDFALPHTGQPVEGGETWEQEHSRLHSIAFDAVAEVLDLHAPDLDDKARILIMTSAACRLVLRLATKHPPDSAAPASPKEKS